MDARMQEEARKHDALTRLAVARRERLSDADYEVYLEDLALEPAWAVEDACTRLRRQPRAEYQTAFPDVGTMLELCRKVRKQRALEQSQALAPKALPPTEPARDMTREEARAFVNKLRAEVDARRKASCGSD